jgi:hypothetical protein
VSPLLQLAQHTRPQNGLAKAAEELFVGFPVASLYVHGDAVQELRTAA